MIFVPSSDRRDHRRRHSRGDAHSVVGNSRRNSRDQVVNKSRRSSDEKVRSKSNSRRNSAHNMLDDGPLLTDIHVKMAMAK